MNSSVIDALNVNREKYYIGNSLDAIVDERTKIIFIIAENRDAKAIELIAEFAKNKDVISIAIETTDAEQEDIKKSKFVFSENYFLRKPLDFMLVIDTNKLEEVYGKLSFEEQLLKINETIKEAIKNIIENVIVFSIGNRDDEREPDFMI